MRPEEFSLTMDGFASLAQGIRGFDVLCRNGIVGAPFRQTADGRRHGFLLVADDVVGGFYALNGGAFGPETGKIFYFAPDTLRWESMNNMDYSELLVWALGDKLSRFYASLGWDGWESEVSFMGGDSALSVYPFLWSKEAKDIARSSRKACPIEEVYELNVVDLPAQLRTGRL